MPEAPSKRAGRAKAANSNRHNLSPLRHLEQAPRLKRCVDAFMALTHERMIQDLPRGTESAKQALAEVLESRDSRALCAAEIVGSGIPRFHLAQELYLDVLLRAELEAEVKAEIIAEIGASMSAGDAQEIAERQAADRIDELYDSPEVAPRPKARGAGGNWRSPASATQKERNWRPPAPVVTARAFVIAAVLDEMLDRRPGAEESMNWYYERAAKRLSVSRKVVRHTFLRYGRIEHGSAWGDAKFLSLVIHSQFMAAVENAPPRGLSKGRPPRFQDLVQHSRENSRVLHKLKPDTVEATKEREVKTCRPNAG